MSAVVINAHHFFERLGTDAERKLDRKFFYALWLWRWQREWREAEEAGDTDQLAYLARNKDTVDCSL